MTFEFNFSNIVTLIISISGAIIAILSFMTTRKLEKTKRNNEYYNSTLNNLSNVYKSFLNFDSSNKAENFMSIINGDIDSLKTTIVNSVIIDYPKLIGIYKLNKHLYSEEAQLTIQVKIDTLEEVVNPFRIYIANKGEHKNDFEPSKLMNIDMELKEFLVKITDKEMGALKTKIESNLK